MTRVFMTKQKAIEKTMNGLKSPMVRLVISSYSLLCIKRLAMSTKQMLIRHKDMEIPKVFIMFN